jgi:hypothetical protein
MTARISRRHVDGTAYRFRPSSMMVIVIGRSRSSSNDGSNSPSGASQTPALQERNSFHTRNNREHAAVEPLINLRFPNAGKGTAMKDFSNASFSPDLIEVMNDALQSAVATLPDPVSSARVQNIAESILRSAQQGERDPRTLQTMALVEMQLRSDEK